MKRLTALTALTLVVCMFLSACTDSVSSGGVSGTLPDGEQAAALVGNIPCEFPLTQDGTTLNIMTVGYEDIQAGDVYVWSEYKRMTGVNVNWTTIKKADRKESIYTALTNKSDIDLIMRGKISASDLTQYGENGLILDLAKDDLLKDNAPNCWAYLQSHHDALASIMNPDGTIYALPQINSGAELRVSRKIYINKTWLENVNKSVPTTTEEMYLLLKAFKEQDANGNGDANDEIPLASMDWISLQDSFYGAFGLANRGTHNMIVDYDEEKDSVRFIEGCDDYKAFLEYFNRLWSEGLIDEHIFTISTKEWVSNAENDKIGVFASTNLASLPAGMADNWVAVENPLEGPGGDKLWTAIRANFHSTGAAVIPTTCDNPELVLRWLDYFWTDEGTLFYHMGVENVTYVKDESGTYDYSPAVYNEISSTNKSFDDVVATYSPYPGGSNPTVEIAPYFMGGEMAEVPAKAARELFKHGPSEYWPSFTFTSEESERLNTIQSDITKYTESQRIDFITGARSFDQWDDYTAQLDKLDKNELLAIYLAAVDRYYAMEK